MNEHGPYTAVNPHLFSRNIFAEAKFLIDLILSFIVVGGGDA